MFCFLYKPFGHKYVYFYRRSYMVLRVYVESFCGQVVWRHHRKQHSLGEVMLAKVSGGLNFLNVFIWNNTTIGKLLWNLCKKKDKLWVKWIHSFYGQRGIWGIQAHQASWLVQRIVKAYKRLQATGYNELSLKKMEQYYIKKVYEKMRGDREKVEWKKLIWSN